MIIAGILIASCTFIIEGVVPAWRRWRSGRYVFDVDNKTEEKLMIVSPEL